MSNPLLPIADVTCAYYARTAIRFHFGAYGETELYVFAESFYSAFEQAVEWLDDHAPGHLVSFEESD